MNVEGCGGVATRVGRERHCDWIEAWSWGWTMTFAPKIQAKILWWLWLSRRFHHTEGIDGRCVRRGGLRLSLVEVRRRWGGIDRPVAQAVGQSPAAVHPHSFLLHCTMGVLGDAQVELGHVITQVCHTRVALAVQKARTHLGQVLATRNQVVFIL